MVDHTDPMSNLRIDLTNLMPFYKHFELLQEPSLFNERFEDKFDKAYKSIGKQVSRMIGDEEETPANQITTTNDEDISVLNIDFFGNVGEPVQPSNQTIQYEIVNRDKQTIEFLMIVQKFKLLQYFCSNNPVSTPNGNATNILTAVKTAVNKKNEEPSFEDAIKTNTDNAFNSIPNLITFLNDTFGKIVDALNANKDNTDETEVIHPFSLSWNPYEVKVLEKYQSQSNTIYGILAKILYNDITFQINSEFISSPEPTEIEKAIIDIKKPYDSERKKCLLKFNGKEDAKNTIERLLRPQ
jgi:hypothetical protein